MNCPNCGTRAQGAFCSSCGTALRGSRCRNCAEALAPGARFCTGCGNEAAGGSTSGGLPGGLLVGGFALVLLAIFLAWSFGGREVRPGPDAAPLANWTAGAGAPAAGAAEGSGMLSGSMRENADRLFNRVLAAYEAGDTAQGAMFLPMAITAYNESGVLDHDGLFHLSLLHGLAGEHAAARARADEILAVAPNHLLALAAAAQAAVGAGDHAAARRYYERLVASYDAERGKPLPEYLDHAAILPAYLEEARAYLAR
jgi:hypothetical protein